MNKDNYTYREIDICLKYPAQPMTFEARDEIQNEIMEEQNNDII